MNQSRPSARRAHLDRAALVQMMLVFGGGGLVPQAVELVLRVQRGLLRSGAGTGLGETFATASRANAALYEAWPSEGGHVEFAPRSQLQCELLMALREKFGGRVSTERIVSGKGIVNVYEFLASVRPDEELK